MKKFFVTLLIIIILATTATKVVALDASYDVDKKIAETISYILKSKSVSSEQELLDNIYAGEPAGGGEWVVIALRQYMAGTLDYSKYREAAETWAKQESSSVATTRERMALALMATGSDSDYVDATLSDSPDKIGIMSYVFGLHLASNGASCEYFTAESLIDSILSLEREGGGWSIMGDQFDVDVTAMTLQALALYKDDEKVSAAIDRGLKLLQSKQLDDGNFGSASSISAESNAQVLVCLSSLGIDARTDERFIKNGRSVLDAIESFSIGDGSYSHALGGAADATATTQVLYSLVSYSLLKDNMKLYHFSSDINEPRAGSITTDEVATSSASSLTPKMIAYMICGAISSICAFLFYRRKKSIKSYIGLATLLGIAILVITFVNFSSAENYYNESTAIEGKTIKTTVSIYCDTIASSGETHVPEDGIVLAETEIEVSEGASVYDQLIAVCKSQKIQVESEGTSADAYISGLAYIYEYDFGELSGWMYKVNDQFADVGCGSMTLKDGDKVVWVYTTNLGKDVGDNSMASK